MVRSLGRRQFLKSGLTAAGGMIISFSIPGLGAKALPYEPFETQAEEINAWLSIDPDDNITIRVAQSEMGQGVFTALPMIIADELEADWSNVRVEYADANRNLRQASIYKSMSTNSSAAVRRSMPYLQQAGAEARERLIKAAAEKWLVSAKECYADFGRIYHKPTRRSVNYGQIAALAATLSVANVKIKTPEQFTLMGLPTKRLDTPAKVNGSAIFGMDVRIVDMVYAAIIHCPVQGGTVRSVLFNAVRNMPGVIQMVRLKSSVAIVAETFWQAKNASEKLPIKWHIGAAGKSYSDTFRDEYIRALDADGVVVNHEGDPLSALNEAEKIIQSDYFLPYLAHAAMEPLNCTVRFSETKVDVWAGVQNPDSALQAVAEESGRPAEQIFVHNCFLGGGFGRRSNTDFVREAVQIAMDVGRPVQTIWSREEDMRSGQYRPMAAIRFKAGFDLEKNVVAYTNHSVTHSILKDIGAPLADGIDKTSVEGLANMPYLLTPKKITHTIRNTHLKTWWWRSVGNSQNAFAMECFVDEMAEASQMDPLSFRKRYLAHRPDLINVLEELEEKSDWRNRPSAGRARGMALHECFGTIVGQVAEVSVNSEGGLEVHKFVSVVDCGNVVNPLSAEMQIESGIIYGLTAAMFGKISIEKGRVLEANFDTYHMLKLKEAPLMETYFLESEGDKWGGLGEPGLPCVAPAIVNAIHKITRRRIRSLPIADYFLQPA